MKLGSSKDKQSKKPRKVGVPNIFKRKGNIRYVGLI